MTSRHPMMITTDVYDLYRVKAGLTQDRFADLAGVSLSTVRRWVAAGRLPVAVYHMLNAYAGNLGALPGGEGWEGWRLVRGQLCSPENVTYTPGEITSMIWVRAQLAEYRRLQRQREEPGYQNVLPFPDPLWRKG